MYKKHISFFLVIILVFSISSCVSTRYLTENQAPFIGSEKTIWVTIKNGIEYKISNPKVKDSEIVGIVNEKPMEISFSDIAYVKIKKINKEQIVLGVVAGAAEIALYIGALNAPSPPPPTPSCGPFVYSFDGQDYTLDAEPYGGAVGKDRTGYTKLNHVVPVDGKYQFRMKNELNEKQCTDELKLLVVDHPLGTDIVPDAKGNIYTISSPVTPISAYENSGKDVLDLVKAKDDQVWGNDPYLTDPDEGIRYAFNELILEFPKPKDAKTAKLVISACNTSFSTYKSREFLDKYGDFYPVMGFVRFLARRGFVRFNVEAWENGHWRNKGIIRGSSPYLPRDQIAILDISDIKEDRLKLRLKLAEDFWMINNVLIDYSRDAPVTVRELEVVDAVDHNGNDIKKVLRSNDDKYYITEKGNYAMITFEESPSVANISRSFIIKARGYYEIHTIDEDRSAKEGITAVR